MSLPLEMLRISSGGDQACALRARAQFVVVKGGPLRSTVATGRQSRAYCDVSIESGGRKT